MYCRVSTKEQVEEGNSLASQEKICNDYIKKNGDILLKSFIEKGESAKTTERTELQALLKFCADRKQKIDYVVVYKLDRIARNFDDYSFIRIKLRQYNVEIKSTSEFFEDSPAGRFMENIIANVAQFDNDVRTERSIGGMKDAMHEGRYVWAAPLGYKNEKVGSKSTIVPDEVAPLIKELFEMAASNIHSIADLQRIFTEKGLINKKGKLISKNTYHRILRNKIYAGWIQKFKECQKGTFPPLVTDDVFEHVQRILNRRKHNTHGYNVNNPDFPLRCFYQHPTGLQLTGSWVNGKRKKYPYYSFHLKGHNYPKDRLNKSFMNLLDKYALEEKHYEGFKIGLKEEFDEKTRKGQQLNATKTQEISDLKLKQKLLIDKNLKGTISDEVLKQQLDIIENELITANAVLFNLPSADVNYTALAEYSYNLLVEPSKAWQKASIALKRKLQVFYFPKGVIFDGVKSGTPEICSIFKEKDLFLGHKSRRVSFNHETKNTPNVPNLPSFEKRLENKSDNEEINNDINPLWQQIAKELIELQTISEIKKGEP